MTDSIEMKLLHLKEKIETYRTQRDQIKGKLDSLDEQLRTLLQLDNVQDAPREIEKLKNDVLEKERIYNTEIEIIEIGLASFEKRAK